MLASFMHTWMLNSWKDQMACKWLCGDCSREVAATTPTNHNSTGHAADVDSAVANLEWQRAMPPPLLGTAMQLALINT